MRRVIVSEFVSLDGVIEDPGGAGESDRGGWSFQVDRGAEGDKFKFDELAAAFSTLLGRETWLLPVEWADGWPRFLDAGANSITVHVEAESKHDVPQTLAAIRAAGNAPPTRKPATRARPKGRAGSRAGRTRSRRPRPSGRWCPAARRTSRPRAAPAPR